MAYERSQNTSGPLGVRVLDLSGAIGAYCSKMLADLGADVLLLEPPGGDPLRRRPPFTRVQGGGTRSLTFDAYHANKRGITLDTTRPESLTLLEALGRSSDVILASPSARRPLVGFHRDIPSLVWARPDAVIASITPFGLSGPLRDARMTPFLSFAMSGAMHRVGDPDGPPLAVPGQLAWDEAGIHGAFGVLAALLNRQRTGGQLLDLSVHEVGAAKDFLLERYDVAEPGEWGRLVPVGIPPTGVWDCADGPLAVASQQEHHWQAFLSMLDNPAELADPAFGQMVFRREIFDLLEQLIAPLMARFPRLELFEKGQSLGLPCAPYNTPGEFLRDVQPLAREIFATGHGTSAVFPWRWCHAAPQLIHLLRLAPDIGEHNREVYEGELGFSHGDLEAWKQGGLV